MKRIVTSIGMVVFAGALIAGATGAFFSDTETSVGNVFTAGAIDLKVDSQQHYNNAVCVGGIWRLEAGASTSTDQYPVLGSVCDGTWTLTDLGPTHKFFNFGDVKPGDQGENTISLHIDNNPAWACADVVITSNDDVSTNEPELVAGDATNTPATNDGELAQNLEFVAWLDNNNTPGTPGDNIHQPGEVFFFAPGPASNVLATGTLTLADGGTGTPLAPSTTSYIGVAWCAGDMTASQAGGQPTCDGSTMGNIAQTDSMTADITFRVEQARNNAAFRCGPVATTTPTGTVTLDKVVTFTNASIAGVDVTDYTLHLVGPGGDHILTDEVAFPGLTPGAYVVSEVYSGNPANATSTVVFTGSCVEIGTTDTATLNVVSGVNPVCTVTNSVSLVATSS